MNDLLKAAKHAETQETLDRAADKMWRLRLAEQKELNAARQARYYEKQDRLTICFADDLIGNVPMLLKRQAE